MITIIINFTYIMMKIINNKNEGGGKTWREYITIPNILKEYNPNIRGYSTGQQKSKTSRILLQVCQDRSTN